MTQPTPFVRSADYTDDAAAALGGRTTVSASKLDAEFDALVTTLGQALGNLAIIQRDDTDLNDGTVKIHTLAADVRALLAASGVTVRGAWLTATVYALKDIVTESGATYICAVAHTAGVFATDLAAEKWVLLANSPSAFAATSISVTPAGGIASSNAQTALEELDTEKLAKASNLSDVSSAATALANLAGLPLAGGTMTGDIVLAGAPTAALHPASKAYADAVIAGVAAMAGRLEYSSATQLVLQVFNGNRFFVEGAWYTIPVGGVTLSNSGLSANTTYYVYAYISGGALTLEAHTDARATDSTYGHQIRTGYASRTLVGMCRTNSAGQFSAIPALVISWLNRKWRRVTNAFSTNRSTTSLTQVEINTEIRCEFLVWSSSTAQLTATGTVSNSAASATFAFISIDGTAIRANGSSSNTGSGGGVTMACHEMAQALSEGYHYATLCGYVGGASTATYVGGSSANACRLSALVEG